VDTGYILMMSVSIKIVIAAVFNLLERYGLKLFKDDRSEQSIFIILVAIICIYFRYAIGISDNDAFNMFFYTIGIDNISKYTTKSITDLKDKIVNGNQSNDN